MPQRIRQRRLYAFVTVLGVDLLLAGCSPWLYDPGYESSERGASEHTTRTAAPPPAHVPTGPTCVQCHNDVEAINPKMAQVACVRCHSGDPTAKDKAASHAGLIARPGALPELRRTCGQCHRKPGRLLTVRSAGRADHVSRLLRSLHGTAASEIAVTRYLFAAQKRPDFRYAIRPVAWPRDNASTPALPPAENSLADHLLRRECLRCHLGREEAARGRERGPGCTACHMRYGRRRGADRRPAGRAIAPAAHRITTAVPDSACCSCHTTLGDAFAGRAPNPGEAASPDVHRARGMSCIDCHSSDDIHGADRRGKFAGEALDVRCENCHGLPDAPSPLASENGGKASLRTRLSGKRLLAPQLDRLARADKLPLAMSIPEHMEKLECFACHAAWARYEPRGVFTLDEREESETDYAAGESSPARGAWRVEPHARLARRPWLMVNGRGKIAPATVRLAPLVTVVGPDGGLKQERVSPRGKPGRPAGFLQPFNPHTISAQPRPCESCHASQDTLLGPPPRALSPGDPEVLRGMRLIPQRGCALVSSETRRKLRLAASCAACHRDSRATPAWRKMRDARAFVRSDPRHRELYRRLKLKP